MDGRHERSARAEHEHTPTGKARGIADRIRRGIEYSRRSSVSDAAEISSAAPSAGGNIVARRLAPATVPFAAVAEADVAIDSDRFPVRDGERGAAGRSARNAAVRMASVRCCWRVLMRAGNVVRNCTTRRVQADVSACTRQLR